MSDNADVKLLPPIVPLIAIGAGLAIHTAYPVSIAASPWLGPFGWLLIGTSVVLVATAIFELRSRRTAFDVRRPTTALVTTGIFGISRNPTYLSMLLLIQGLACVFNSLALLVVSIPTGSILCRAVIRREEDYLRRKFGSEYLRYSATVRRWI